MAMLLPFLDQFMKKDSPIWWCLLLPLSLCGLFGCSKNGELGVSNPSSEKYFEGPCAGIAVFDCNGDGRRDVVLLKGGKFPPSFPGGLAEKKTKPRGILVFFNLGRKRWKRGDFFPFPGKNGCLTCCRNCDLDGDGDQDLVVGWSDLSGYGGKIAFFMNNGRGHFSLSSVLNSPRAPFSIISGDLDGDGDVDLAAGSMISDSGMWGMGYFPFFLLRQDGRGSFTMIQKLGHEKRTWFVSAITSKDLNGDGLPEIIIGGMGWLHEPAPLSVFFNKGNMQFRAGKCTSMFFNGLVSNFQWVPNFSKEKEILALGVFSRPVYPIYPMKKGRSGVTALMRKSGPTEVFKIVRTLPEVCGGPVLFGDLDGDGDADMVVGGYGYERKQKIHIYFNNGSGKFSSARTLGTGNRRVFPMALCDLDDDFRPDLIFVRFEEPKEKMDKLVVLYNDGKGNFH